jgi:hypothetical protein
MTVSVSTASAVEQVVSAVPEVHDWHLVIAVIAIVLITIGNLRGLRESGNIFAVPTYLFVGSAVLMIGIGVYRIVVNGESAPPPEPLPGASSMSEGVGLLLGITFVANSFGVVPIDEPVRRTVISQVAATIYGDGSIPFYLFQTFTALILFLAANTSYNAFPRLAAILARDGYMPRQFSFRGDRLAFTSGIVILSIVAVGLIVAFGGETHALIPLYSVGVFVAFTVGQSGMIVHWLRERPPGWRRRLAINSVGCAMTGTVAVVVMIAKAPTSLLVVIVIPILVGVMWFIHRQYSASARELAVRPDAVIPGPHRDERVIVPVPGINRAVVHAVNVGRSIATDVRAVLISDEPDEAAAVRERWERQLPEVPLVIVESPYRALVAPMLAYLDVLDAGWPADQEAPITFVIIPEYVARSWWERILYNQSAKRLRTALLGRPRTVVVNVAYRREQADEQNGAIAPRGR